MVSTFPVGADRHGGRLSEAAAAFPDAPSPWLDLSTGVNPQPWRGRRADWTDLSRLPDPADLAQLERVAAAAFGVEDASRVVATAGAEAGLRLLPQVIGGKTAAIVSPTYSGHAQAWQASDRVVMPVDRQDISTLATDVLIVVNPNNPDGACLSRRTLEDLAADRCARGLWTVVDESFVEVQPTLSIVAARIDRLVVLRSFGKFYGLPGARLGFVVAAPSAATALRARQGEWPVSADALRLGWGAYADQSWRDATRYRLDRDAAALDQVLALHGLTVTGGTSLFRYVFTPDAGEVFTGLCRRGILTRPFQDAPQRLRIGLPGPGGLDRLAAALCRELS